MEEKKRHRNALRSKRLICNALAELLLEKPFEKITVTDITNRADLNRTTFYCHYQDIHALVDEMMLEAMDHHMSVIKQNTYRNLVKDPTPYLQTMNRIVEENLPLYKALVNTDYAQKQLDLLLERLVDDVMNAPDIPEDVRRRLSFRIHMYTFLAGLVDVYKRWLKGEIVCSLEEISSIYSATIGALYSLYYG